MVAVGRARAGLAALLASMALTEAASLASLASSGLKLRDSIPLSAAAAIALLEPAALALEVAAIALVALGSAGRRRRLALAAGALFAAWAALNAAVFLPLSLAGARAGSLELVRLALSVKAGAALLQCAVPLLLMRGFAGGREAAALWAALAMTAAGSLGLTALPIGTVELVPVETPSGTLYAPRYHVDYASWPYPALLALSHLGGALYMIVCARIAARLGPSPAE